MIRLSRREETFKKINAALLVLLVPISSGCGWLAMGRGDSYATCQAVLALILFTLPPVIKNRPGFSVPQDCRLLYYLFIFCTIVVGSAMYGYSRIPYWDKLFHFFSGILISAAGLIICHLMFHALSGTQKARRALYILFPFLFNLSAACLWEVYEYMLYILFGIDAVNNAVSGVNDTLQDMIVCLLGGILFTGLLLRAFRTGKSDPVLNICIHFFYMRGQKLEFPADGN